MYTTCNKQILLSFLFIFSFAVIINAQKTIKGKILSKTTKEPVAYANIGVKQSNAGTISNEDGSFSLFLPKKLMNDSLFFSSLGFMEEVYAVKYFDQETEAIIYLNEKIISLETVVLNPKTEKMKTFELGNQGLRGGVLETDTTYSGRSIALLINNDASQTKKGLSFPMYIENARIRIFRNNLENFKIRVRIHAVDELTKQPGTDLLQKSVVLESVIRKGWLNFDLSEYNLRMDKPFFVTFEQIIDLHDRITIANGYRDFIKNHPNKLKTDTTIIDGKKVVTQRLTGSGIDLPGTFIGISTTKAAAEEFVCFVRETSFAEWKRVTGIITATVTVSN